MCSHQVEPLEDDCGTFNGRLLALEGELEYTKVRAIQKDSLAFRMHKTWNVTQRSCETSATRYSDPRVHCGLWPWESLSTHS